MGVISGHPVAPTIMVGSTTQQKLYNWIGDDLIVHILKILSAVAHHTTTVTRLGSAGIISVSGLEQTLLSTIS